MDTPYYQCSSAGCSLEYIRVYSIERLFYSKRGPGTTVVVIQEVLYCGYKEHA